VQYGKDLNQGHGGTWCQSTSPVQDRSPASPAAIKFGSGSHSKVAAIKENLNSKTDKQGANMDDHGPTNVMVVNGHRTTVMGLNQTSAGPMKGYKLTQGLISLFRKTRTRRCNPKWKPLVATPTNKVAKSSAQGAARGMINNSGPYCYRCLSRGHPKEECSITLSGEICENASHVKGHCLLLKKAKTTYAMTCGYAVNGLGFYYIPNLVAVRPKSAARLASVRVVEGEMTALQVKAELERLVPAKMSWVVEELEHNQFKTIFPSRGELKRMIEWGLVHTKDRKAMLLIEELGGGSHVKQVMRKVWVQMTRLPSEP
jgi:hypothetical protein